MKRKTTASAKRTSANHRSAMTRRSGGGALWNRDANDVVESILKLKSPQEARRFLRDLLTEDEIRMIAARWRVAKMLDAGKSYRQIEEKTGLSSRTIARISHWLQSGKGGYRLMTNRKGKVGSA